MLLLLGLGLVVCPFIVRLSTTDYINLLINTINNLINKILYSIMTSFGFRTTIDVTVKPTE